jgi:hypothetical protein
MAVKRTGGPAMSEQDKIESVARAIARATIKAAEPEGEEMLSDAAIEKMVENIAVKFFPEARAAIQALQPTEPQEPTEAMFRMQRGPAIPWRTAEVIYAAYSSLYGNRQSLQRMHERGGFGWKEVEVIFDELRKRDRNKYADLTAMRTAAQPTGGAE